jgi:O-antigen/teichoic acid export membrane protein
VSLGDRLRALAAPFLATGEEGQAIQRSVGWLAIDRVFRLAVGTVLNVWTINYLGPNGFGLFSFAQSVVGILAILSQLGLETLVVRDLVRHPERSREVLGSTLALRLTGAVVVLVASIVAIVFLRPGDRTALGLAMVFSSIYFFLAFDVIESWYQSQTRVAPYVIAKSVAFVLSSIVKAWALAVRAPIEVIAGSMALEFGFASVALIVAFRREPASPRAWRPTRAMALGLLRDAWPLVLNNVAAMLAIRLD